MNRKLLVCVCTSALLLMHADITNAAGDAGAGKEKAATCTSCHGVDGQGINSKNKISGLNIGKFKTAMQEYKTGKRENAMMQMFAKKLSDQDIEDLAAYYSEK